MQLDERNATITTFDFYINKSIEFVSSTVAQLFHLLLGLISVILIGKFMGFLFTKDQKAEAVEAELKVEESDVKVDGKKLKNDKVVIQKAVENISGWESLALSDCREISDKQSTHIPARKLTKSFRRKCMSVGPIILSAHSQLVRTLDEEDGEERYRYDILALEAETGAPTAENVCVPRGI